MKNKSHTALNTTLSMTIALLIALVSYSKARAEIPSSEEVTKSVNQALFLAESPMQYEHKLADESLDHASQKLADENARHNEAPRDMSVLLLD